MSQLLLDAAGRRRSPATLPGFHAGRPPRNKGRRYPADPPTIIVIQRQLGHTSLGVTSIYLQGIDSAEIIDAVHARRAPMIPVDASLRL
jgi:integrase